jgi:dienelactone hydrolase
MKQVIFFIVSITGRAGYFSRHNYPAWHHGFAEEYVELARRIARNGCMGIAACWFAGRKGAGTQFIRPIACKDAPPLIDVSGLNRFRLARQTIDSIVEKIKTLPGICPDRIAIFGHSRGAGAALD